MARIAQINLFSWKNIEASSDLIRLDLILSVIPDESLMQDLETRRGKGRNDYPVRAMWNALLAGVVFQHSSAAQLIREFRRNRELADKCGFDPLRGLSGIPGEDAFGRFLALVVKHQVQVLAMFEEVVRELAKELPDLGTTLALDSKALPSFGRPSRKESRQADGRRDTDADVGVKKYQGCRDDGSTWQKLTQWFGYKLHLIVDSKYEIPLSFSLTKASCSDVVEGQKLVRVYRQRQPDVASRARELSADRGYDSGPFNAELHDTCGIHPIIDTRQMWKSEKSRPLYPDRIDTIVYDERGQVSCVCMMSGQVRDMAFMGFEKGRETLKYRCPAAACDLECAGRSVCEQGRKVGPFGRIVRIPIARDRRIFTPVARHSYKWKKAYNRRSSVERVFSRVDRVFGFENHTIRGEAKMEARVGLAMLVNVCMVLGRIRAGQAKEMRSFVLPLPRAA